ncbi:MAG: hypothetical protein JST50_00340 [Bacteroidetes bacterium]|jgi:cytoskeletal protein RodZ|nr:hypothetical protein [Bacteroidota bacterium]
MEKGMNMQDKEFDDLFRSKLGGFEVQPSAEVWQNIDAELSGKKKKGIFPMLSIAASVLILLVAGILFIPKKGVVKHNKQDTNVVAKANPAVVKPESTKPVTSSETQQEQVAAVETPIKQTMKANQHKIKTNTVEQKEQANSPITKTVKTDDQPLIASTATPKQDEVIKQIELTEATSAETKEKVDNSAISLPAQPILASNQPAKAKPVVKKRGIRNFGDIVNLVVAKVDKRKDKLIEFKDNDDDESVISAVHLGALKIKRDN